MIDLQLLIGVVLNFICVLYWAQIGIRTAFYILDNGLDGEEKYMTKVFLYYTIPVAGMTIFYTLQLI